MKRTTSSFWLVAISAFAPLALTFVALAPVGCSSSAQTTADTPPVVPPDDDSGSGGGDGSPGVDSGPLPGDDGGTPKFDDGMPTRIACSKTFGMGLAPPNHGRLDGQLVTVLSASQRGCPNDSQHMHLQVKMSGAIYDIAVNLDGLEGETDAPLPGSPYAEGWHPMGLDYVRDLKLHSSGLTLTTPAAIRARVEVALTNANHVSIFGYAYPGSDGAHLIHRSNGGNDGAIVINPLAAKAHVLAFRFSTDTF